MAIFNGMNISASGMTAQTMRMDTIAQNLANIDTTRDENGNVYRRKTVVFAAKMRLGLHWLCSRQDVPQL